MLDVARSTIGTFFVHPLLFVQRIVITIVAFAANFNRVIAVNRGRRYAVKRFDFLVATGTREHTVAHTFHTGCGFDTLQMDVMKLPIQFLLARYGRIAAVVFLIAGQSFYDIRFEFQDLWFQTHPRPFAEFDGIAVTIFVRRFDGGFVGAIEFLVLVVMALGTGSEAACFGLVIRALVLLVAGRTGNAGVRVFFGIARMKAFRLVAFGAFLVNGLLAQYTMTGQTTVAVELIRYLAICC